MTLTVSESARLEALEHLVADQAQRIAALEARIGRLPEELRRRNDERRAEAARLRQAIATAAAVHPSARRVTAKHVLQVLARADFGCLPAERTVRKHLAALRGSGTTV